MARPGRPRKHDPKADAIRQAITYDTTDEAVFLLEQTDINITDGEVRTPLMYAALKGDI